MAVANCFYQTFIDLFRNVLYMGKVTFCKNVIYKETVPSRSLVVISLDGSELYFQLTLINTRRNTTQHEKNSKFC